MFTSLQKNIVLYLFTTFLIVEITGCKPSVNPSGRAFLSKVSRDISTLATELAPVIPTKDTSNATEIICKWVQSTPVSTNQYLAIGLLDSSGSDFFSYDLVKRIGEISEKTGDYSDYKAMQPLLKGHKFSTGTIHWGGMPYGIVCRVVDSGKTNSGVVILFLSPESIKNADITIDQFSNNVL
ncbi:hypothetical protein DRO03_05050 [Methanosarcinales archaeon]|nr:MAG: hypothetical protein DRO03_05050 [Methanosarcinales archaeon]